MNFFAKAADIGQSVELCWLQLSSHFGLIISSFQLSLQLLHLQTQEAARVPPRNWACESTTRLLQNSVEIMPNTHVVKPCASFGVLLKPPWQDPRLALTHPTGFGSPAIVKLVHWADTAHAHMKNAILTCFSIRASRSWAVRSICGSLRRPPTRSEGGRCFPSFLSWVTPVLSAFFFFLFFFKWPSEIYYKK